MAEEPVKNKRPFKKLKYKDVIGHLLSKDPELKTKDD